MEFADGYPIGNGRIGVMCFGGPAKPMFSINHYDLWYRPPSTSKPLPGFWADVRRGALAGEWPVVGRAIAQAFDPWGNSDEGSFQPGALLEFWLQLRDGAWNYRRTLDLRTATATTEFDSCGYHYSMRAFPHPTLPLATIELKTTNPEGWLGRLRLFRPSDDRFEKPVARSAAGNLNLQMRFPEGTQFEVGVKMNAARANEKAAAFVQSPGATAAGSSEATLGLPGARSLTLQVAVQVSRETKPAEVSDCQPLRSPKPIAEKYLSRAAIDLPGGNVNDLHSPPHYQRMFEVGRYVFATSSCPEGLPPNLQGIWNERIKPPCNSDFHMDLNVQMALWHVPAGNLLEYHEAFFRLIEMMLPGARENARCVFEMRGLAFPTCSYGHGEGRKRFDAWVGTSGWLLQHYWKHWRYTLDETFLRERFYPILREVCRFYLDYLVEDNGRLIIIPSESPENRIPERANGQYGRNSTYDLAVFRALFSNTLEAAAVLRDNDKLIDETRHALSKLSPYALAQDGRLREMEDYEFEKGHRHLTHLYPLFAGDEITPESPKLFRAAKLAIDRFRSWPPTGLANCFGTFGEGAWAGWTYPLVALCHARLGQGDGALEMLKRYSKAFTLPSGLSVCFETHDSGFAQNASPEIGKWIQTDAPLGAVAAIQEMLLQSHRGIIRLLPALPKAWREGSFRGLRAEEGFEVDVEWHGGRLATATVKSLFGRECRIKVPPRTEYRVTGAHGRMVKACHDKGQRFLTFPTQRGSRYEIEPRRK